MEVTETAADELAASATNGDQPSSPGPSLDDALAWEQAIADEAALIRGSSNVLTPGLFFKLWPLLKRPIPPAFVETVGKVTGKPYESTGIKSVQVQIDRMNNVMTPLWWRYEAEYDQGGKLCTVTVTVTVSGVDGGHPRNVDRTSRGGVDRGSTIGNVYKGSFTNAAKLAFARLGPGHEIYLGTTDFDPDVSADEAAGDRVGREIAGNLWTRAKQLGLEARLQLAASHVVGRDVGDCKAKKAAQDALSSLSFAEGERLDSWLSRKADEQAGGDAE